MNDPFDHEDPIEEVAATWLTQRAEGLSLAQKREFARWCRADARHAAAVARLEAACALLEKMPQVRPELQPVVAFPVPPRAPLPAVATPRPVARWLMLVGAAAVVAVVALGGWRWGRPAVLASAYATAAGGYQRVLLSDGSILELNANTEVRVSMLAQTRHVALVAGEAHFTVAHDAARPFIVAAHRVAVRAVGTAFNVRLAPTSVEVLVTEGRVVLAAPTMRVSDEREQRSDAGFAAGSTMVSASQRALVSDSSVVPVVEKIAPEIMREALSWQERKLVFAETPLREVVAQFNRRNRIQLVLGDVSLAERPVGGTFAADNVEGFVRLLESSGAIAVERRDESSVVLRAVR